MSLGSMRSFIYIVSNLRVKDSAGFGTDSETILASARAYKEIKRGNETWKNRAAFSSADVLFRLRVIPKLTVTTDMVILCDNERYNILSVEDVRERGRYLEILASKVIPTGR